MKFPLLAGHSYTLQFDTNGDKPHRFCGSHELEGGICPNCQTPLLRFMELDLSDPLLSDLQHLTASKLSLVFCWKCNVAQETFYYRQTADTSLELLEYGREGVESDFPYEDYPLFFPEKRFALLPLPTETLKKIHSLNTGRLGRFTDDYIQYQEPIHQIGGQPILVQRNSSYRLSCCQCGKQMTFFCCIGDACGDPRGFVGNPYVQVLYHQCAACRIIGCFQQTD
jgi:hypothetical protein